MGGTGTPIDPALSSEDATENNADQDGKQLTPNSQPGQPQPGNPPMPMHPPHPDRYQLPPVYPPAYPPQQMGGYPPNQPAPRQRTAIACRYCRRRKIRCSGFDQSEDGRCTNCVRFSQECIFTPVSAQTQAFVPAHALYRGQNAPANQPLYGAYGQPLRDQQQQQQYPQQQPGQYPPTPQGYQQPPMYQQQPPPGAPQMQGTNSEAGRKRPNDEPHTPTHPPPNPGAHAQMPQHRGAGGDGYPYPDPSGQHPAENDANGAKEAVRKNETRDFGVQVNLPTPPKERDSRKDG